MVVVGYALSFWLLALILKDLDIGFVYAVWSGVGTALIAAIGIFAFGESATALKFASVALIIAGVVGLNAGGASSSSPPATRAPGSTRERLLAAAAAVVRRGPGPVA